MVRYQNLTRKPELFRAPLDPVTMYPMNPPLAGPVSDFTLAKFAFPPKTYFLKFTFGQNYIFPKNYFPEFTLARIYLWPKLHFPEIHFAEFTFDQNYIFPKNFFRMYICQNLHQIKSFISSVAGGGGGGSSPPIGLKNMQNRTFLVLLRPIFAQKMKTGPSPKEFGCRSCKGVAVIRPEEPCEFPISAEKSVSISVKTFFFVFCFVFGDHLVLAEKPFEFPISAEKSVSILNTPFESDSRAMKIRVKVAYSCLTFSKKPPPFRNPGYAPSFIILAVVTKGCIAKPFSASLRPRATQLLSKKCCCGVEPLAALCSI